MLITVVIPTRDRPWQLREALQSVLRQTLQRVEVIVVDDGSQPRYADAYRGIADQAPPRVRFLRLPPTRLGHGPSHARNMGAAEASTPYLTFLDDDDCFIDMGYLERLVPALAGSRGPVDLHLSNQYAYRQDVRLDGPVWLEDLRERLRSLPAPDPSGARVVSPRDLFACAGFAHLNTTVVSRRLFDAIGGFDASLRYEGDRDFYLRAVDGAEVIKYSPAYVARHNVPNAAETANVSTALPVLQRALHQLRLLDKAILFARRPEVQRYARRHRAYTLKRISEALFSQGEYSTARYYAWSALPCSFGLRWMGFCLLATLLSAVPAAAPAHRPAAKRGAAAHADAAPAAKSSSALY